MFGFFNNKNTMGLCYSVVEYLKTTLFEKKIVLSILTPVDPKEPEPEVPKVKESTTKSEVQDAKAPELKDPETNAPEPEVFKRFKIVSTMSEEGHYFISVTQKSLEDFMREFQVVKHGVGWTTLHVPQSGALIRTFDTMKEAIENEYFITLEFMLQYGIHKVRGSKFSNCVLTFEEIQHIKSELAYFFNACIICNGSHDEKNCPEDL